MKRSILSIAAIPLLATTFAATSVSADDGMSILSDVKFKGQIRPRYEYADVKSNGVDAGNSYTNRLQLSATGTLLEVEGLSATVGVMSVNNFGSNDYRVPGQPANGYDIIADDQQAMLSEAILAYKINNKTSVSAGRRHLNLDDQRFIGTVGWRQLERSYDTVQVNSTAIDGLDFMAAYVYGYAGVVTNTTTDTRSVLLHGTYKVSDSLSATGYGYLIGSTYDQYGVRLKGTVDVGAKVSYLAEYAIQDDASLATGSAAKPNRDASYMKLDIGTKVSNIILGAGYEYFSGTNGSDGKTQFIANLGTNHKFNGWADQFYVGYNPTGGLIDMNVRVGYAAKGFGKFLVVYHDFSADKAMTSTSGGMSDDFGSEINVLYANKIPGFKNLKGLIKYASYSKAEISTRASDVEKAWVMLDYKF